MFICIHVKYIISDKYVYLPYSRGLFSIEFTSAFTIYVNITYLLFIVYIIGFFFRVPIIWYTMPYTVLEYSS